MLKSLFIKNFVLFDNVELELSSGLNIITGETGSGKSMLADALIVLFGGRASSDFVRQGEIKAVIEGTFVFPENSLALDILKNEEIEFESNEIILRREISAKSSSRCFVNDSPVQASILRQIGESAVDFHGQHEHQSLLKPENHLSLLSGFANDTALLSEYRQVFDTLSDLSKKYDSLVSRERKIKEEASLKRFKLEEIEKLNLKPNEDSELETELNIIENSETLFNLTSELYTQLYDGDGCAHDRLFTAEKNLQQLVNIDPKFNEFLSDVSSALVSIDEAAKFARSYSESIEFSPQRIEEIRLRLLEIKGMKKKYGSVEDIISLKNNLIEELTIAESFDIEIEKLKSEIGLLQKSLGKSAEQLSKLRTEQAKIFEGKIVSAISELGMPNVTFQVMFQKNEIARESGTQIGRLCVNISNRFYVAYPNGIDNVEFYISTNKGEPVKPLSQIASGGEISRIMLALKSIAAAADRTPLLVFDEIDSGISGRIARKTGIAMKNLAENHQIIAITHLPQIAALGELNISVEKLETNGRTSARARILNEAEKLNEVAKLISGEDITESAIASARELILSE